MATAEDQLASQQPTVRCDSPSQDANLSPAMGGPYPQLSRKSSTMSQASATDSAYLGSDAYSRQSSSSYYSRRSDVSNLSRQSTNSHDGVKARRRGFMRPQGTDFAASARSRESVMSLGSIAHLQYYFARTGLLDGKGGQLARKKPKGGVTLDLAALEATSIGFPNGHTDTDSSYASMGSSPDMPQESPLEGDGEEDEDSFTESESGMLDPTVSTYNRKEVAVPKPPTIHELKAEVESTLAIAEEALQEVRERKAGTWSEPPGGPKYPNMPPEDSQASYELQGMHILDVVTLAIRAAKMYYTAHELPDRLDAIKSEKQVRADLLAVMETLKQMGIRNFKGGMREDEVATIESWIESVWDILRKEAAIEAAEQAERASWTWLTGDWTGRELERERAFLISMDPEAEPLPPWTPVSSVARSPEALPTPFLQAMQNGLRLIKLHNAAVKKSRRRFGAIPTFHADTQKPYRCADNLRYWVKAAELRFEVLLSMDALGIQYNSGPEVWIKFEEAILKWCRHVREEISNALES